MTWVFICKFCSSFAESLPKPVWRPCPASIKNVGTIISYTPHGARRRREGEISHNITWVASASSNEQSLKPTAAARAAMWKAFVSAPNAEAMPTADTDPNPTARGQKTDGGDGGKAKNPRRSPNRSIVIGLFKSAQNLTPHTLNQPLPPCILVSPPCQPLGRFFATLIILQCSRFSEWRPPTHNRIALEICTFIKYK